MPRISDARPLHELYGTTNRRRHFPDVAWHHLLLAARNTAAAFHSVHAAGVVIGDVNQGNLLVDKQMCVRLIDLRFVSSQYEWQAFFLPGWIAALHAARTAGDSPSRRLTHRGPRSVWPVSVDIPFAFCGTSSVCRQVCRFGRPAYRKGNRRTSVCLFPRSHCYASRAASSVALA